MADDFADWTRGVTWIADLTAGADVPDWTVAVVNGGGGGGAPYASLTGPGETATPGALTQTGDFEVDATTGGPGNSITLNAGAGGLSADSTGTTIVGSSGGDTAVFASSDLVFTAGATASVRAPAITIGVPDPGGSIKIGVDNGSGFAGAFIEVETTSSSMGFFGHTPVAGPVVVTGSRGGNAALASLLTGLASLGLITDSTT